MGIAGDCCEHFFSKIVGFCLLFTCMECNSPFEKFSFCEVLIARGNSAIYRRSRWSIAKSARAIGPLN